MSERHQDLEQHKLDCDSNDSECGQARPVNHNPHEKVITSFKVPTKIPLSRIPLPFTADRGMANSSHSYDGGGTFQ